jgi:phage shock protein PspC (stress-responsive transcriptional regulator)
MQQGTRERWYRGSDRIVGGVCSGLAAGLHIDPLWVRVAFVLLALVQGIGVLLYLVLWILMPERVEGRPEGKSGFDSVMSDIRRGWGEVWDQLFGTRPVVSAGQSEAPGVLPAGPPQAHAAWSRPSVVLGGVLIVAGLLFLAENLGFVTWSVIWPTVLIVIGVLLLLRALPKRT